MSKDQLQVNNKQIMIFLGVMVLMAIGFIGVLAKATSKKDSQASAVNPQVKAGEVVDDFLGEKGETLQADGDKVFIEESKVSDGSLRAFKYYSQKTKKNIHFFIVKASDGTYRAAADACEVCFGSKKGFKQVGDQIRCENCRTTYSKDQIALQKGGCNSRPIDKDVEVINGRLAINLSDIEKTADLF